MWVGIGRITLEFYGNDQLKIKKRELDRLFKDLKRQYNLSILEVDEFDDIERSIIGISATLPASWSENKAQEFIGKVKRTLDETSSARIIAEDWELVALPSHS